MPAIFEDHTILITAFQGFILLLQFIVVVYLGNSARVAARERNELNKEIFGLVKKLEGLTAHKREQVLKHYDGMLEQLSHRLPATVAAQASEAIFETESKILKRLAELEPHSDSTVDHKGKIEGLISSMERLEHTLVNVTADTVRQVMVEGRKDLMASSSFDDASLAA